MRVIEKEIVLPAMEEKGRIFQQLQKCISRTIVGAEALIRFVVTQSDARIWRCEVSLVDSQDSGSLDDLAPLLEFRRRSVSSTENFNAVFVVPTGIGAEIGGHAGDATPAARIVAASCDLLIIHPNVVNASDINEAPHNSLYVEGSVLTRFLMGTIGLQQIRSNRVLVVIDDHPDLHIADAAINTVSAARATYGFNCSQVIKMCPPIQLWGAMHTESGRAVGEVRGLGNLLELIAEHHGEFDALALASVIRVPHNLHLDYFNSQGQMINPWGGVEAMLTHAVSSLLDLPSAHAPMFESREIENLETGIVEPRMSAEAVSVSFLQCVLKGLHDSPKIVTDHKSFGRWGILSAEDVGCLVIPDGCLGFPTIAALEQGIPVIAVRENKNLMQNDLSRLPWAENQFYLAENYLEAAGMMNAIRCGVSVESVLRPILQTKVQPETAEALDEPKTMDAIT